MTAGEKIASERLWGNDLNGVRVVGNGDRDTCRSELAADIDGAIAEALKAEREACAVAVQYVMEKKFRISSTEHDLMVGAMQAIRARGAKEAIK